MSEVNATIKYEQAKTNLPGDIVLSRTYQGPNGPLHLEMGFFMSSFTREAHPDPNSSNSLKQIMVDRFEYYINETDTVRGKIDGMFRPHPNDWYAFQNNLHMAEGAFEQCAVWDMFSPYYHLVCQERQLSNTALYLTDYKKENPDSLLDDINIRYLEAKGFYTVQMVSEIKPWEHEDVKRNPAAVMLNGDPDLLKKIVDELNAYIIESQKAERERMVEQDSDPIAKENKELKIKLAALQGQIKSGNPATFSGGVPDPSREKTPDPKSLDFGSLEIKQVTEKVTNNPNVASHTTDPNVKPMPVLKNQPRK